MSKISIIIPCYNSEKYLPSCLDSALNQTYQNLEIIAINDGSEDNTLNILRYYQKQFPKKMKVINLSENMGPGFARNRGLEQSQGEYINFIDSDDVVTQNMIECLFYLIKEFDVQIAQTIFRTIEKNEYLTNPKLQTEFNHDRIYIQDTSFIKEAWPTIWGNLIHRDLLINCPFLENALFEDIGVTYSILLKAEKIAVIKENNYFWRNTPNSIINSFIQNNNHWLDLFKVYNDALQKGISMEFNPKKQKNLEDEVFQFIKGEVQRIGKILYDRNIELLHQFLKIGAYETKHNLYYEPEPWKGPRIVELSNSISNEMKKNMEIENFRKKIKTLSIL